MKAEILNKPDIVITLSWKEAKAIKDFIGGTSPSQRYAVSSAAFDDVPVGALHSVLYNLFKG